MCMGCMSNAEFLVASGVVGAASLRVGLRALLPTPPAFLRKVTDEEAAAFVAAMQSGTIPAGPAPAVETADDVTAEPALAELDPVG